MSRVDLDQVADEIWANKARVTFSQMGQLKSNCMYLLVYFRYVQASELKEEFLCAKV